MKRTGEVIGSYIGTAVGTLIEDEKTAPIVYVIAPIGVIPSVVVGATIGLLTGNKVGSEIDRHRH